MTASPRGVGVLRRAAVRAAAAVLLAAPTIAHQDAPVTHRFGAPAGVTPGPWLSLDIVDAETGHPLPARFTVELDGRPHAPAALGENGLRLETVHHKKDQRAVTLYATGAGRAIVPLPAGARDGVVTAVRGFEYLPARAAFRVERRQTRLDLRLRRWIDPAADGWHAGDVHLHYERLAPAANADWLTALAADGLTLAHFLVLKGGNLPGLWARQYAFGDGGQAGSVRRWIRAGQESRDRMQGHALVLGADALVEPLSTGGPGDPPVAANHPPLHDGLRRARELGGVTAVAHGTALGRNPTGELDAVLGVVDAVEIANTHLYELDAWYRLLRCGVVLPPVGGTDLPNHPFRDAWQPLLGETRTYVRAGDDASFAGWRAALREGRTLVSSGPWLELSVEGVGPGGQIHLPAGGGDLRVVATLASPQGLHGLQIVHDGRVVEASVSKHRVDGVERWRAAPRVRFARSGWIAARGSGLEKRALRQETGIRRRTVAHTAAVQVIVGGQPIRDEDAVADLIDDLRDLRETYRRRGAYDTDADRQHMLDLFDEGIRRLRAAP